MGIGKKKEAYTSLDMIMSGQILSNEMRKHGFSVSEIQKKLKLSCPQPIYRWLKGETMPSIDNLYMMSKIFSVHMEDLLVPKHNQAWILHITDNKDMNSRMKLYYGVYRANG